MLKQNEPCYLVSW